ncbi:hypothetical protein [Longispora fulva]|uniref:Uncharacterized protein n=1 Tax=Longispora fulva TaxID=619741 RepID=A0A8J7GT97_9ACTN|nr:hypothetical protein [Longispora fulva]MBG6136771.1 hypothetical protein [Longispora fulva]
MGLVTQAFGALCYLPWAALLVTGAATSGRQFWFVAGLLITVVGGVLQLVGRRRAGERIWDRDERRRDSGEMWSSWEPGSVGGPEHPDRSEGRLRRAARVDR